MTADFVKHAEVVAASVARSVERALVEKDLTTVQSVLDAVLSVPDVEWAFVRDPNGQVLAHTFAPRFPAALERWTGPGEPPVVRVPGEGAGALSVRRPVLTGTLGTVFVGFSRASLAASTRDMEIAVFSAVVAVSLVVALLLGFVTRRLLAPVRDLTRAAEFLSGTSGSAFRDVPVRSGDELGVLTRTFNRMAREVRGHGELLEAQVEERTRSLSITNAALAAEIAERKRVEESLMEAKESAGRLRGDRGDPGRGEGDGRPRADRRPHGPRAEGGPGGVPGRRDGRIPDETDPHAGKLEQAAHLLRGSASNFGPGAVAESALVLEQMGRSGVLDGAPPRLAELTRDLEDLSRNLKAMVGV